MADQGNWFGRVYADVIRDKNIPATSKAIYAYLAVLCGSSDECFPSVQKICDELNISRDTFYRQIKPLVSLGIVEKKQSIGVRGQYGPCVYRLKERKTPCTDNADTAKTVDGKTRQTGSEKSDSPCTDFSETKEKYVKENQLKKIDYRGIADLYNQICISFPKIKKMSESRKRVIKARINDGYTVEDFRTLFEMAEGSSFLKGENDRGWSATFDWMISDCNMTKILEGNYSDRRESKTKTQPNEPAVNYYSKYQKGAVKY